jgi:hypothetical protein
MLGSMCVCGGRFFYRSCMTLPERLGFAVGWLKPVDPPLVVMDVDELAGKETDEEFMERKFAHIKNRKQANG